MNSMPTCSRLILFFLLPFVIVFSVVYLISSSSPIATNNPLSNELSSTISLDSSSNPTTASTVVKTIHQRCQPYNVSDTRPFFEREPPQSNLPRRVSNSTRNGLRRRLRGLRLALVACAYNVEKDVDKFRKHVEPIIDLFHPSSRIYILESDSRDNTLAKLRQWSRAKIYTYGNLSRIIPRRTDRIAYCRNKLLEKARQLQPDYMLVLDLDIFATNVSSFLTNFDYDTHDWSVMTANLLEKYYYDIWALRTLSDSIMNFDIWHRLWAMEQLKDYCKDTVREYMLDIHIKRFPPERPLLEVRSAFDGAGLYKMEATNDCYYSGDPHTCEHVPFHVCMREKNQARIFINPKFINYNSKT
jgi:hypothetical protein